jgi:anti-sigma-K factor RskA
MNQTTELHDLLAPYALGALDRDEERAFEEHLIGCASCRELLPSFQDASAALAIAAGPRDPPEALRRRILAGVRPNAAPTRPAPRWRIGLVPALAGFAAAAACAAIGLGIWSAVLHGSLDRERSARDVANAAVAVLGDPAARRVAVSGASGVLAVRPDGRAVLALERFAPAPAGKTYEAWVIESGAPKPAGLFRGGDPTTLVPLDERVPRGAVVAVTVEVRSGVQRPTSKPILSAKA